MVVFHQRLQVNVINLGDHLIEKLSAGIAAFLYQVNIQWRNKHHRIPTDVIAELFIVSAVLTKNFFPTGLHLAKYVMRLIIIFEFAFDEEKLLAVFDVLCIRANRKTFCCRQVIRSEERRVGKEWSCRLSTEQSQHDCR